MNSGVNTKRILVIHYSQTGQLNRVVKSVVSPLMSDSRFELHFLEVQPQKAYPFPWPFIQFINAFPEAVHERGCALQAINSAIIQDYDLIVLGYQVWYLAPATPITAFLKSVEAKKLFAGKPVVTVIACRDMWLQAQEKTKKHLQRLQARLIGNIALVDEAGSGMSFFSTPLWMLSGRKGPFRFGIPAAGVSEAEVQRAVRFGEAIKNRMLKGQLDETVLQGLGAVKINTNQIASEKIGTRSFHIWGKLFLLFGGPDAPARKLLCLLYVTFLVIMIATVVPVNYLVKRLTAPLTRKHNKKMRDYFAQPSGESTDLF